MGYDIVVFDKRRRYHSVEELNANFHKLDDRDESKDYNDYRNSTPELQNWFLAIKDRVRPLNGEFAPPESEIGHRAYHEADYVFGRESIWVEFAYSDMDRLYDTVKDQARRNDVAFWDVSGTGAVFYPDGTVLQTPKQQLWDEYQRKFVEENEKAFKRHNEMTLWLLIPWTIAMIVCLITGQLQICMLVLALLFIIAYPMKKWMDKDSKDVKKKLDLWYQQMVEQQAKAHEVEDAQLKAQPMVYPAFESFAMADMESIVGEKDVCVAFYEYYGDHLYYIHYVDDKAKEIFVENAESHEIVSLDYDELDEYYQQLEGLSEMLDSLEVSYVGTISMEDFKLFLTKGLNK